MVGDRQSKSILSIQDLSLQQKFQLQVLLQVLGHSHLFLRLPLVLLPLLLDLVVLQTDVLVDGLGLNLHSLRDVVYLEKALRGQFLDLNAGFLLNHLDFRHFAQLFFS